MMKRKIITTTIYLLFSGFMLYSGIILSGGGHDFSFFMLGGSPIFLGFFLYPYLGWISQEMSKKRNRIILVVSLIAGYIGILPFVIGEHEYGGPYLRKVFIDELNYYWNKPIFVLPCIAVGIYLAGHAFLWYSLFKSIKNQEKTFATKTEIRN